MMKQKGMTLIGMLLTMVVVALSAVVVLRVVPVYLQYYAVVKSINSLNESTSSSFSGDPAADTLVLRESLNKRLDMNGIDDLKPEQLSIVPDGERTFLVTLNYQVIKPLLYNVSLMFDFKRTDKVKISSEN